MLLTALGVCGAASAQSLESVLMPGKVVRAHAKYEDDCAKCHVKFDRGAQGKLCQQCHKDVAADIRSRIGYHGRIESRTCSTCHTEHKGRDAKIVALDANAFDHSKTDFILRGKHAGVACSNCHRSGTKHRDAPTMCISCHRKDDIHKGTLGENCSSCHREQNWKRTTFDHAATRFPLQGRHSKVQCADCHPERRFKDTQRECSSCHRKDDPHRGTFGAQCESCHVESDWKSARFDHERSTRFALRGAHRPLRCSSCHRASADTARLPQDCIACHRADDVHKGALGTRCQQCHSERGWTKPAFNHARDTRFALRGRHDAITCQSCHVRGLGTKLSTDCADCHRKDDPHRGNLGEQCSHCHTEVKWQQTRFQHDRDTKFPLLDRHRDVPCKQCHADVRFRDKPSSACSACHRKDDPHNGQLGSDCAGCHSARGWRESRFDHASSRFPLLGAHEKVRCKSCHASNEFKNASRECVACHVKDDAHEERLGSRCAQCHDTVKWKQARFDHDRQTKFPLTGKHTEKRCTACHTQPVRGQIALPKTCSGCHDKDDVHFATYGKRCETCHTTADWRQVDKEAASRFLSQRPR